MRPAFGRLQRVVPQGPLARTMRPCSQSEPSPGWAASAVQAPVRTAGRLWQARDTASAVTGGEPRTSVLGMAAGTVASSTQDGAQEPVRLARGAAMARAKLLFEYGQLPPDHPVQQYVAGLVARFPIHHGVTPRVYVLPFWWEENACCTWDGAIFVSLGLLKRIAARGSLEELIGILAHEYVHAYRAHLACRPVSSDFLTRALREVSMMRLHEWEADMRGTAAILGELGIPYAPFEAYLMREGEARERRTHQRSIVHGSGVDRALNIALLGRLIDLRGSDVETRTPWPAALDLGQVEAAALDHAWPGLLRECQLTAQQRDRGTPKAWPALDEYSTEELFFALEFIDSMRWRRDTLRKPLSHHVWGVLTARSIPTEITDAEQRTIWEFVLRQLYSPSSALPFSPKTLSTPGALTYLSTVVRYLTTHPPVPATHRVALLLDSLIRSLGENAQLPAETLRVGIVPLAEAITAFDTACGSGPPVTAEQIQQQLERAISHRDVDRQLVLMLTGYIDHLLSIDLLCIPNGRERIAAEVEKLFQRLPDRTLVTWNRVIWLLQMELNENPNKYSGQRIGGGLLTCENFLLALPWLFFHEGLRLVEDITPREREMIRIVMVTEGPFVVEELSDKTRDRGQERLKVLLKPLVEYVDCRTLVQEPVTHEDVALFARYATDGDFALQRLPLMGFMGRAAKYSADVAVYFLRGLEIRGMVAAFEAWRAMGVDVEALLAKHPDRCGPLVMVVVEALQSGGVPTASALQELLRVSAVIGDPYLRARVEAVVVGRLWPQLSFEEKLALLFPPEGARGVHDATLAQRFFEEEMTDGTRFARVRTVGDQALSRALDQGHAVVGLGVLADIDLDFHDVLDWLKIFLSSRNGDSPLRARIYDLLKGATGVMNPGRRFDVNYYAEWRDLLDAADQLVRQLYSLGDGGRHMLVRKFLTARGGALRTLELRQKFLQEMLQTLVRDDGSSPAVMETLTAVSTAMAQVDAWKVLFFGLAGLLSDRVVRPPEKPMPWYQVYEAEEDYNSLEDRPKGRLAAVLARYQWDEIPATSRQKPWRNAATYARYADGALRAGLARLAGSDGAPVAATQHLAPMQFVVEAGERIGTLGVRLLQQLPLVVPSLSPEIEQMLSTIFDQVEGQTKPAALQLAEREWPEFWETVAWVGPRLGGGSMVTVYPMRTHAGEARVVKVLNPNLVWNFREAYAYFSRVLDQLVRTHDGVYEDVRLLLDDMYAWVMADASFEGFLEDDTIFRTWVESLGLRAGPYCLRIPRSFGPESRFLCQEEQVTSINLTQWDALVAAGHDMQQIVRLYARFYMAQLLNGMALSDLHTGNVGVTAQHECVIYDRNLYVKLTPAMRAVMTQLLFGQGDTEARVTTILSALQLDATDAAFHATATALVAAAAVQDWARVQREIIALRKAGGVWNYQYTLVLKNLRFLARLAARAGFGSLRAALIS